MTSILVIEDNDIVRKMVARSLNDQFTILEASEGFSGVRLAQENLPDLIICDIAMPGMDGFGVLEALRSQQATASIPFVFLTAQHERNLMRRGMAMGADDYITKPFTVEELRQAVQARLKKRAIQQEAVSRTIEEVRQNIARSLPHELRTAIMVADGYAHLIESESENMTEEQKSMVGSIRNSMSRLYKLAENFLWYSKTELSKLNPDSVACTNDTELVIRQTAHDKAKKFSRIEDLHLDLHNARLTLTEDYLAKIIDEIVENAFKFSVRGTVVQVCSRVAETRYLISISNDGQGLKPPASEKIDGFMQFERDQYEQQGVGLGLAIAKRLVAAAGGELMIENTPEDRITVAIQLPLAYQG